MSDPYLKYTSALRHMALVLFDGWKREVRGCKFNYHNVSKSGAPAEGCVMSRYHL